MLKPNKKIIIVLVLAILLAVFGASYAFFSAFVSNTNNQTVNVETGKMILIFSDGDNGISASLNLGESITKKFTIQNTGTLDSYARIEWVDLINTYISDSLTYTLQYSETENGEYLDIMNRNVPTSNYKTTRELSNILTIPANTTFYYKLTIKYNNLKYTNQNKDISAVMNSFFRIVSEPEPVIKPAYYALPTDNIKYSMFPGELATTDYKSLNADIFLGADDIMSSSSYLCILIAGKSEPECFSGAYFIDKYHLMRVFGDNNCTSNNNIVYCNNYNTNFNCELNSLGIQCKSYYSSLWCRIEHSDYMCGYYS